VKERGFGHEIFNFKEYGGRCYGYGRAAKNTIALQRLSALKEDDSLDDVLLVWVADSTVVGWFKHATLTGTANTCRVDRTVLTRENSSASMPKRTLRIACGCNLNNEICLCRGPQRNAAVWGGTCGTQKANASSHSSANSSTLSIPVVLARGRGKNDPENSGTRSPEHNQIGEAPNLIAAELPTWLNY